MKGFFKRAAAALLAAVMAVAMFAGCSKSGGRSVNAGGADSMFGVLKASSKVEKKTFNCDVTLDADGATSKLKLSGVSDGNATLLNLEVSAGGMSFKFENAIVFTDDVIYFNVAEIMDEVGSFATALMGAPINLADFGITSDWVSFKAEGMFKQDTAIFDAISEDLDEAYADVITEKDGTYAITVSDQDSLKALAEATKKLIEKNGDDWAKLAVEQSNKVDVEKILNDMLDEVLASIVKAYEDAMGEELSDSDIAELKEAMLGEVDTSKIEQTSEDDYKKMFDELVDQLDDALAGDMDLDGTVDVRTSYDKGVYTIKANLEPNSDENGSLVMISTVTEDKSAKVDVPSDAQPLVDIITAFMIDAAGLAD